MKRILMLLTVVALMVGMLAMSVAPAFAVSPGVTFKQNCTGPSVYSDNGTKKWRDDTCSTFVGTFETTNLLGYVGTWETYSTTYADGRPDGTNSFIVACETPLGEPDANLADCYGPF